MGGKGFGLADGDALTVEGSEAEQSYEGNGKECGQRRKDVSRSLGEDEVVGLSTGWAGRAHCRLATYEPRREGQRESLQQQEIEKPKKDWEIRGISKDMRWYFILVY